MMLAKVIACLCVVICCSTLALAQSGSSRPWEPGVAARASLQDQDAAQDTSETDAAEAAASDVELEPGAVASTEPEIEITPQLERLRDRIRTCMRFYYQAENTATRSPWGVMHSLIGYGVDTELIVGRKRVNAIGWLCWNGPCRGMRLLYIDNSGQLSIKNGPGYQGHEGQFLAMLAQSRVKIDYPMKVNGQDLTIADLVEYEKRTCRPRSELTFKLIALAHYLESDATWTTTTGEPFSIPRLIREELAQPINGVTCGGTHRLMGFSYAVRTRQKRGEPIEGEWERAQKYVEDYLEYAFKLQNRDGSFSTEWLKHRANNRDPARQIQTTGHILEWVVYALPKDDLDNPRVIHAVDFLTTLLLQQRNSDPEVGPKGHAIHALSLYNERVFGEKPGKRAEMLVRRNRNTGR
jgi:hypothetical protein